jgi:hypothetical protein
MCELLHKPTVTATLRAFLSRSRSGLAGLLFFFWALGLNPASIFSAEEDSSEKSERPTPAAQAIKPQAEARTVAPDDEESLPIPARVSDRKNVGLPGLGALPARIEWDAQRQYMDDEIGAIILSGAAWLKVYPLGAPFKVEADHLVLFMPNPQLGRAKHELYAEGNIRFRLAESEISAQAAYVNVETGRGWMIDAVMRVSMPTDYRDRLSLRGGREGDGGDEKPKRVRDPFGVYLDPENDPQARIQLIVKADKLIRENALNYRMENAFVSNDTSETPLFGVKVRKLDFVLREKPDAENPAKTHIRPLRITGEGAQLQAGPIRLFPLPTVNYDLSQRMPFIQSDSGQSNLWGPFAMFRFGWAFGRGQDAPFVLERLYVDVNERWKRGPGGGLELEWKVGRHPSVSTDENAFERGSGHLRVQGLTELQTSQQDDVVRGRRNRERRVQPKIDGFPSRQYDANRLFALRRKLQNAGPPSFAVDTYQDELRGELFFQHHQPFRRLLGFDDVMFDFKYNGLSDRDYLLEYSRYAFMEGEQPEALASVRKAGDNYSSELLYRTPPQGYEGGSPRSPVAFGAFTGYEPAFTYWLTPTPIGRGVYLSGEAQAARMHRWFDRDLIDASDFFANRAYLDVEVERPWKWGAVNFRPHVGTLQSVYDESRQGEEVFQGALTYGLDVTSRIYGLWPDLKNEALDLEGMRHVIEPRLEWGAISDPRESAEDLLDFDEVDDLQPMQRVRFALDQTVQTKRAVRGGGTRSVDVAGLNTYLDAYPRSQERDRLLGGNALDLWHINGFLRVHDLVRLTAATGINLEDGEMETASYGIALDSGTRWRVEFQERFNYGQRGRKITGSDQFISKFEYRLSERWGFSYEQRYEQRRGLLQLKGRQLDRLGVTRHYGPIALTFTYFRDRLKDDQGYFLSMRPQLAYRNLAVSEDDLLAVGPDIGGDGDELPEESDFDPFKLLERREKMRKEKKQLDETKRVKPQTDADSTNPKVKDIPIPLKKKPADAENDDWDDTTPGELPAAPAGAESAGDSKALVVRPD